MKAYMLVAVQLEHCRQMGDGLTRADAPSRGRALASAGVAGNHHGTLVHWTYHDKMIKVGDGLLQGVENMAQGGR